jgi:hypothetical protein
MRRCGRAYCLLLVCLFVTAVTAGGALAAPGANGNKGKGHAKGGSRWPRATRSAPLQRRKLLRCR